MRKRIGMLILTMMVALSPKYVNAEMPNKSVVVGEKAYELSYANDSKNVAELRAAMKVARGNIFIKVRDTWYRNDGTKLEDISIIPAVTYVPSMDRYREGDGELIKEQTEVSDEIFTKENIKDITNWGGKSGYIVEDDKLVFTSTDNKNYLNTALNANINDQGINIIKNLIDDNHYLYVGRNDKNLGFNYGKSRNGARFGDTLFSFYLFENELSLEKYKMRLNLNTLIWEYNENKNIDEFYSDKLESTIYNLFGEKRGSEIFQYILEKYNQEFEEFKDFESSKIFTEEKDFNGIEIMFKHDPMLGSTRMFFFKY